MHTTHSLDIGWDGSGAKLGSTHLPDFSAVLLHLDVGTCSDVRLGGQPNQRCMVGKQQDCIVQCQVASQDVGTTLWTDVTIHLLGQRWPLSAFISTAILLTMITGLLCCFCCYALATQMRRHSLDTGRPAPAAKQSTERHAFLLQPEEPAGSLHIMKVGPTSQVQDLELAEGLEQPKNGSPKASTLSMEAARSLQLATQPSTCIATAPEQFAQGHHGEHSNVDEHQQQRPLVGQRNYQSDQSTPVLRAGLQKESLHANEREVSVMDECQTSSAKTLSRFCCSEKSAFTCGQLGNDSASETHEAHLATVRHFSEGY